MIEDKLIKIVKTNGVEEQTATDKQKLLALADFIDNISIPVVTSHAGKNIAADVKILFSKTSKFIREKSDQL